MIGPVITVPSFALTKDGVDHFFGTKHSRVGATAGAASDLKNGRGARARLISVKQVHGTDVLILDRPVCEGQSFDGAWDALMTNQPGIMVAVRTADCVPVLLHDPVRRIVAAVHAGWRGAVAGIVPNTIAAMNARFGGEAAALRMAIGPSVGACCYEVDEPVLSKLRHAFPDWQLVIEEQSLRKARLNLRELIRRQALVSGLAEHNIAAANACTMCHPNLFFSYRREGVVKGTMVSGIALVPRS
jgi:purine-nucleoside/S-methyl-5'-thioadenosine phosphorylase / adenosine deaminase